MLLARLLSIGVWHTTAVRVDFETNIVTAAFEGLAHPYKENIVKFGNQSVLGNLPEVKEAFKESKESKPSA